MQHAEENPVFDDIQDDEFEWECQGGQKLDKDGNLVDKYYKKEAPVVEFEFGNEEHEERELASMATKPWMGAIVAPSNPPAINKEAPSTKLKMEYVYGYRAIDSRNNVFYTAKGNEIVYMTAALGVVLNCDTNEQRFFGGGEKSLGKDFHDDDISALAIHPNRKIVATGQVGKDPTICVWTTDDCRLLKKFNVGKDLRAVKSIGFSNSGKFLAATCDDNDHTVVAWDWESGQKIAATRAGPDAILDLNFSSTQDNVFATVGKRGVAFWTIGPGTLTAKKGIFGSVKASDMYCAEWLSNGKCITGALNGNVYVWQGQNCVKTIPAHKGLVSTISAIPGGVVTGGKDNVLVYYTEDFKEIRRVQVPALPKALDQNGKGSFVVGLRDGSIIEFVDAKEPRALMLSHCDGELWGLAIDPQTGCIVTVADDNKIMVWDPTTRQCANGSVINEKAGVKAKIGGASTLSVFPPNQCARAVAINPVNGNVAVGINNGEMTVRASIHDLETVVASKKDSKEWIEAMQYSPCGKFLAVGSHDNNVYIYDQTYKKIATCKKNTSFITSLDWSTDSHHIQTVSGSYEILFFNAQTGEQLPGGATALKDEKWATWTGRLGWPVQGIYCGDIDLSNVNGIARSHSGQVVADGDDYRCVNLLNYPCLIGTRKTSYIGHSEHVTRVAWDSGDHYLYSIGGYDRTLIQWRVL